MESGLKKVFYNRVSQKQPAKKSSQLVSKVILITAVLGVIVGVGLVLVKYGGTASQEILSSGGSAIDFFESVIPKPELTETRQIRKPFSETKAMVTVYENTDTSKMVLAEFAAAPGCVDVVMWDNNLVTLDNGNVTFTNIKTGYERTIKASDYLSKYKCYYSKDKLLLRNNQLFIDINGPQSERKLFYLTKEDQKEPTALPRAYDIKEVTDQGLIVNCRKTEKPEDSSGGICLLNSETKELKPIEKTYANKIADNSFLGIDAKNRMLFAGEYSQKPFGFSYIYNVPLTDPAGFEGIVATQNMPACLLAYGLSEDKQHLVLAGQQIVVVNLDSYETSVKDYELEIKACRDDGFDRPVVTMRGDVACIDFDTPTHGKLAKRIALNYKTKEFKDYAEHCVTEDDGSFVLNRWTQLPDTILITTEIKEVKEYFYQTIPLDGEVPDGWEIATQSATLSASLSDTASSSSEVEETR